MAFRPHMSLAMERATRLARIYGILMLLVGIAVEFVLASVYWDDPHLISGLAINALTNALPGAVLWFLSTRMDRVELWSFIALACVATFLVLEYFLAFFVSGIGLIGMFVLTPLRLSLMHLIAATMNSMPEVMDGYRGYRRDKQMTQRHGFEPIFNSLSLKNTTPPPPATTLRSRRQSPHG